MPWSSWHGTTRSFGWFVIEAVVRGVAGATEDDWFARVVWHAFLESTMPSLEAASFDVQARLLLDDLLRIEIVNSDLGERHGR
jgi:hypothetical protein